MALIRRITILLSVLVLSGFASSPTARAGEASPSMWTYQAASKLFDWEITMFGDIALADDRGLTCLDGATGSVRWQRPGRSVYADGFDRSRGEAYAFCASEDSLEIVDPETGACKWRLDGVTSTNLRGISSVEYLGLYLVLYKAEDAGLVRLRAHDLGTGGVRWIQDSLFTAWPEPTGVKDENQILWNGRQRVRSNADSTLFAWPAVGGPIRIDLRTGDLLWRCAEVDRRLPKPSKTGDPTWILLKGTIVVASKKHLAGIRASDGTLAWIREADYPGDIELLLASSGRVWVVGPEKHFVDVIDPMTGNSVLRALYRGIKDATAIRVEEGTLYFVAKNRLRSFDFESGTEREIAKFKPKHDDFIRSIAVREEGYRLQGAQNLIALSRDGDVQFHRDYPAPGLGLFDQIVTGVLAAGLAAGGAAMGVPTADAVASGAQVVASSAALTARYAASHEAKENVYFYTDREDAAGRKGFSLVRVDKGTGAETGRIWIDSRRPQYLLDGITGRVFVLSKGDAGAKIAAHSY